MSKEQYPENNPQKNSNESEDQKEKSTFIQRFMAWMQNNFNKGTSKIEELYSKAANSKIVTKNYAKYDKFMRNPVVKILTSNTLSRAIAVVFIASAALGITTGGWPIAGAGIAAVAMGIAIDTFIVDRTRRVYKEAKFLHRHRQAADAQELILQQNPHIAEALADKLYEPKKEGKSQNIRLTRDISTGRRYAKSYLGGLATAAIGFTSSIVGAVLSHSPIRAIGAAGGIAFGAMGQGSRNTTLSQKREDFRQYIDSERDKDDSPAYDNLLDIRKAARKQKIQSMALEMLKGDPEIMTPTCDEEIIKARFEEYKQQIEKTEKSIIYGNNVIYRTSQLVKNIFHAHNPLSEYSEPDKVGDKLFNKINNRREVRSVNKSTQKDIPNVVKLDAQINSNRHHAKNVSTKRANKSRENHGR